jgi:glycogen phosphorylase
MSRRRDVSSPLYAFLPTEVPGFESLADLALDLHYSWNPALDELWRQLDAETWELTQNPWVVLQTVSRDRLRNVLANPEFRKQVENFARAKKEEAQTPGWFRERHPRAPLSCIAYFSMEFMLSEALPIYSGGLGNVAGDQLKAASDLGVPVVGVGLLWQQGYFRQVIDRNGAQQALFPYNDPGQLPITPVREPNGEWLRLEISLPGYSLRLRVWQVEVGRVKLYLLDSNDASNYPAHRGIISELYGGGPELRLEQELALGLGGWRLLRALGLQPEVCHLNEGHAAFAVLERARNFMEETGQPFEVSLAATRAGNLFTTHTPVAAGFDRFSPDLVEHYLGGYAREKLGLSLRDFLALGRRNPDDPSEPFNLAFLAVRGSGKVNAVSRLHGEVSRRIFQPLFPRWPEAEVPVGHVTNGIHTSSWESPEADRLWTERCGSRRWKGTTESLPERIRGVSDSAIWEMRAAARSSLVQFVRRRLARQLRISGPAPQDERDVSLIFDPDVLTLGFARRFATYKRPNLLLHDPGRLLAILTNPRRPVQMVVAGKAHPEDLAGQAMIQQWTSFARDPAARRHVVFLSDYDMTVTQCLVQGVDVWINTPRRPWEACGTSGMKVLANGGLNLSELDGWWAEAYAPEVGWALGDGRDHGDDPAWDAAEAGAAYSLLEREIVPGFYTRDAKGIPTAWVARIRESIAQLAPQFSANRAVREYAEQYYLPCAAAYRERAAGKAAAGREIVDWEREIAQKWEHLRFGELSVSTDGKRHAFEVQVYLDALPPDAVRIELYAQGLDGAAPLRVEMVPARQLSGAQGWLYRAEAPATRPASDFTPRLIPSRSGVSVPLEAARILWQR